jgi:hypothetical protein
LNRGVFVYESSGAFPSVDVVSDRDVLAKDGDVGVDAFDE